MQHITITIKTPDLSDAEHQKLLRDIAIIQRTFAEAGRSIQRLFAIQAAIAKNTHIVPETQNAIAETRNGQQLFIEQAAVQQNVLTQHLAILKTQRTTIAEQTTALKEHIHTLNKIVTITQQVNKQQKVITDAISANVPIVLSDHHNIGETETTSLTEHLAPLTATTHIPKLKTDIRTTTPNLLFPPYQERMGGWTTQQPTGQQHPETPTYLQYSPNSPPQPSEHQQHSMGQSEHSMGQSEHSEYVRTIANTVANVPTDALDALYATLIQIPTKTHAAKRQLQIEMQREIQEINDSEVLSAREKAHQIEQIEKNAAERRKAIEMEASQAKIDAFNKVVQNFITGIGQMIKEQIKLRIATAVTHALIGSPQSAKGGASNLNGLVGASLPALSAHPALLAVGSIALGTTALFSGSYDDPINDALARQAGIQQAQQRAQRAATALGRRSAADLKQNFETGFVRETTRQTAENTAPDTQPTIMNEIKLIIGAQELKAIYEETQRHITTGIISHPL